MLEFDKIDPKISLDKPIALITARKGSRRIKNKNIKKLDGKPVISYAIKTAKKSKIFQIIVVSTDCKKIAKISQKYGAKVFFLRPKYLSKNNIGTIEVLSHFAKFLKKKKCCVKYICCIYPATPLLKYQILKKGFSLIKENIYDYVMPVSNSNSLNSRGFILDRNFLIKKIFYKKKIFFSLHYDVGQFYWGKFSSWLLKKNIFANKTKVIVVPNNSLIDINTLSDWQKVKKIFFKK
jgi:pseudaminic acid cytidylyltransferase